jgi:UDP-glucose 4-epimerase
MRMLVTGGAGFIGSHVVDHLITAGHEVAVIDDLSGGFRENINSQARFYKTSITDTEAVEEIFDYCQFDCVYHLAAYAAEGLSHFIRRFNYENNVIGSVNLINSSIRNSVKCFVFTSSIAVYGSGQTPFTEDMTPAPEDPYGIAKYAVEIDLSAANRQFGLPYIIFRPHNVYGERQNIGDPYRNVIGIWMNQIMKGEPCTVFGDGWQTRAFTHIDDVAPVIANSAFNEDLYGEIFNVGSSMPCTVNSLLEEVQLVMGNTGTKYLPPRKEVVHAFSDHTKLEEYFPKQTIDVITGISRMAVWVKKHGARISKPFDKLELEKGLPPSWTKAREFTIARGQEQ